MHTYKHAYIHAYIHACIHTCIHTYVHTPGFHNCIKFIGDKLKSSRLDNITSDFHVCRPTSQPHVYDNSYFEGMAYINCLYFLC